jgi:hypothetical protein
MKKKILCGLMGIFLMTETSEARWHPKYLKGILELFDDTAIVGDANNTYKKAAIKGARLLYTQAGRGAIKVWIEFLNSRFTGGRLSDLGGLFARANTKKINEMTNDEEKKKYCKGALAQMLFTVGANGIDGVTTLKNHNAWKIVSANKVVTARTDYKELAELIKDVLNCAGGQQLTGSKADLRFLANQALNKGVPKEEVAAILMAFLLEVADTVEDIRALIQSSNGLPLFDMTAAAQVAPEWTPERYADQNDANTIITGIDNVEKPYSGRPLAQLIIQPTQGKCWADCVETCVRNIVGTIRLQHAGPSYGYLDDNTTSLANAYFKAHGDPIKNTCSNDIAVHNDWAQKLTEVKGITYPQGSDHQMEASWTNIARALAYVTNNIPAVNDLASITIDLIQNNNALDQYLEYCKPPNSTLATVFTHYTAQQPYESLTVTLTDDITVTQVCTFTIKLWPGKHAEIDNVQINI